MVQGPHRRWGATGGPTQVFYDRPEYEDLKPSSAEQDFVTMTNDVERIDFETLEDAVKEAQETLQICDIFYNSIRGDTELRLKNPGSLWSEQREEKILALYPSYNPYQDKVWVEMNSPLFDEEATYIDTVFPDLPEEEKLDTIVTASIVSVYTFPIIT